MPLFYTTDPQAPFTEEYGWQVLYGRDRERATLAALVERARAGQAGVLVVLGEPGIGKSALVHIG